MKIKCVKSTCQADGKLGLMQIFFRKDATIASARIRHYIGTESGKPKFTYCIQTIAYAEAQLNRKPQKPLIESVASKAIAIGENHKPDQHGQAESGSNKQTECGCSLAWFRTSACHVDDPGSNPGNRTILFFKTVLWLFVVCHNGLFSC
jgi:hypothetical protein